MKFSLDVLSSDAKEIMIVEWNFKEKDSFKKDDNLLEVSTDKATFDVAAPFDGSIEKIYKQNGDSVTPDEIIADLKEL